MKSFLFTIIGLLIVLSCKSKKESAEFFNRGNYHYKLNEYEKAKHFYDEAILKNPDLADAYNNRGLTYLKLDFPDRAVEDFEKAVSLDPKYSEAKYNLAKIYSQNGKLAESEELFNAVQSNFKNSSAFFDAFGQNYMRQNKLSEAKTNFEKSIALDAKNVSAITNLGYLYSLENNNLKAKSLFMEALKNSPNFSFALNNLAVLYTKEKQYEQAVLLLKRANSAENILINNNLAFIYLETENIASAKALIDQAVRMDAENPYTKRNLAILKLKTGEYKKAYTELLNLEHSNPEVDYIYYFLGISAEKLNLMNEACQYLKLGEKLNDGRSAGKCN